MLAQGMGKLPDRKKYRIRGHENRAITIMQLRELRTFLQRLCKTGLLVREGAVSGPTRKCIRWFDINMYDICDEVIKKLIMHADPDCPVDPETGNQWYSWVEFIAQGRPQKPEVFFSHWWGGRFRDLMQIVEAVREDQGLSIHAGIWICTFALCQFGENLGSSLAQCPFRKGFEAASSFVLVVDRIAGSLGRSWCGFEMHLAVESMKLPARGNKTFSMYTPAGKVGSKAASSGPLLDAIAAWDIRSTFASQPADRRQILNSIAGVHELDGIRKASANEPLLQNGFKSLEAATSDHEDRLFLSYPDRFEDLNTLVRTSVAGCLKKKSAPVGYRMDNRALKGITLGEFRTLVRNLKRCCEQSDPIEALKRFTASKLDASSLSTHWPTRDWPTLTTGCVIFEILVPMTSARKCSYVELVSSGPRLPEIFVAHEWQDSFAELAAAIDWQAESRGYGDNNTLFIDATSCNFHDKAQDRVDEASFAKKVQDTTHNLCMDECQALLVVKAFSSAWAMWDVTRFLVGNLSNRIVDLGCSTGVLACTQAFIDGCWEFGDFDPALAGHFYSTRVKSLDFSDSREYLVECLSALYPDLTQAQAFKRIENHWRRLSAGPVLRASTVMEDLKTVQEVCSCPGLSLNSNDLRGCHRDTVLHVAVAAGKTRVIKALVELLGDVNARDEARETPLHYAAITGNSAAAELLLQARADPHVESVFGQTALELAKQAPAAFRGVCSREVVAILATP
eukprot:TRINITY_DN29661_c0_g1_i3.p1 TRINITY_DN29661_c0_g1~~TRINITY_DN29661_c0_g1_i3.p1  ORF type:complete len:737 (+),score=90.35 TRINITY_DN29661_c0_g1_i3:97-2307(+)